MCGRGGKARGPGPRSYEALQWLSRVDVAGIEPLALAMGFGPSVMYSHVARLAAAGLVVRVFDPGGSMVAITAEGRRAIHADRGDVRAGATHGSGLRHARAVSWVAAILTIRERQWLSERELRGQEQWQVPVIWTASRGRHRPDAGVLIRGARVAIEVELSHKSPRRLQTILSGYEHAIARGALSGGLIYVCDRPDVLAAVRRAPDRVALPRGSFVTRTLESVQADARRLGRQPSTRAA